MAEPCKTEFEFEMKIDRIYESPRVTKPYTEEQWAEIAALGHAFGPNSERGVYKSTDGGANWKQVLSVDERTGASELSLDPSELLIVGAPVQPGFDGPRFTRRHGRVFPRGHGNVVAEGLWGFTEDDGTPTGRTPPAIRRATMLLVLRSMAPLADDASFEARSRWRIIEERTRDQSYRLDPSKASASASLTGDPEIDALLALYVRPTPLGAA